MNFLLQKLNNLLLNYLLEVDDLPSVCLAQKLGLGVLAGAFRSEHQDSKDFRHLRFVLNVLLRLYHKCFQIFLTAKDKDVSVVMTGELGRPLDNFAI